MSITTLAATAIDHLYAQFPQTVFLRRKSGAGAYVDGYWNPALDDADVAINGCFWDMPGDEQENMRDELRHDDMRVFWTRTPLEMYQIDRTEDKLVYQNDVYDIIKINKRFEGAYYRVVLGRNFQRSNSVRT